MRVKEVSSRSSGVMPETYSIPGRSDERSGRWKPSRLSRRRVEPEHRAEERAVVEVGEGLAGHIDAEERAQRSPSLGHVELEQPSRGDAGADLRVVALVSGD